jgi:alkanesulfonate monooxygenase SsuD/methylene tetrahydromethanopterin reductase-like flavin-dependent oxidoreductase (luciferase family)
MAELPIGVNVATIGVEPGWWLAAARRLADAGYGGIWCWDHLLAPGDVAMPVVEAWTALTAVASTTERIEVGPFVANVMNRHPALLARMATTLHLLSGGRLVLGIGIGGGAREHAALGMPLPEPAERVARLREAVAVLRALWSGSPVTRASDHYPLLDACALPALGAPPPIIVGGETRAGARLAAEIGDGWTAFTLNFRENLPAYLEALSAAGRDRAAQRLIVGTQGGVFARDDEPDPLRPWVEAPTETWQEWRAAGADGAILTVASDAEVDRLVAAVERW